MSVTVTIAGGPSGSVPWSFGMNGQSAMEAMWNQIHSAGSFSYALEYYGSQLGYMVLMIDGVYDTPTAPFSYWELLYNGQPATVGIDGLSLNDGDQIEFTYISESTGAAASTWSRSKRAAREKASPAG